MSKILVSVVNYCDPEFLFTIKSLWESAENKDDLIFSIVSEDTENYDLSFIPESQIIYRHYDLSEYRGGLCWARNLASKVEADFDYFIQFDSHTYAHPGWDKKALEFYKSLPQNEKKIISYCPADYEIMTDGSIEVDEVYPNKATIASDFTTLIPGFSFPTYQIIPDAILQTGYWVTCCYLFAPKEWLLDVGISPTSSFNTEEFKLSLKTYALGWKVYAKAARDVFHHSSHRQPNGTITRRDLRPWSDERKSKYWNHVKQETNDLSMLMSGQKEIPLEKVQEFFEVTGISKKYLNYIEDYYSHVVIENRGYGMPPARDYF
jgi:hypothetical protein